MYNGLSQVYCIMPEGRIHLNKRVWGEDLALVGCIWPPVAWAADHSRVVVLFLLIYCLMYLPLIVGVLCLSLFCYALLCVHSSFAIILKRKRKLVAFLLLSYRCIVTIKFNVVWLFLTVLWVGLQCVIVVNPDHTHLLFIQELIYLLLVYL